MKKNVAGQTVAAQLIASADGSNVTTGTTTVYVLGDGGTQGAGSGTVTHEGNGLWSYVPTQAETNYDHVAFTFTNSSAITTTVQVYPSFPQTVDNATNITAIKTKTDFLPSATAGAAGGVFIAGTNAPVTITGSGDALTLSSTGGNGRGIYASGNGTGAGIRASGGATGDGITAISTAGNGISASSTSGRGISATGGTNNHGIYAAGTGTGSGLTTAGGLTGHGIYAAGGGTSGNGITATGLTSGHGMSLQGTGSSKHGLYAGGGASGTSDGIYATAGSGGVDIRGNITGNLTGTVSGIAGTITTLDALPTSVQIAAAVWDRVLTGATHNITNSAGRRLRQLDATSITDGTAQAGAANSITLASGASSTNEIYDENLVVITGGTGAGQTRVIVEYNGTTKVAIVNRVWEVTPDNTSEYEIIADAQADIVQHGLAQGGSSTSITLSSTASSTDDIYNGSHVYLSTSTGSGQTRLITDYNGTTKVATVSPAWVVNPTSASVYKIIPVGRSIVDTISGTITTLDALNTSVAAQFTTIKGAGFDAGTDTLEEIADAIAASSSPTVSQIADAVWDEALSGHATAGSTGAALSASGGASDPLLNTVPGSYASGTAGHALGRIGSARVTATSPVATGGDVTVTYGDDYYAADGRALDWTGTSTNIWPDLTSATITVYVDDGNLTITGSVVTPTGTQKVRCQPTATETATLTPGVYDFDVKAALASSAHVVTLVRGKWTVTDSESV